MSFDFSTLITDRSQADVEALRAMLSTALTDWTAEQLDAFNKAASKGAYNYTDLNRVTAAMDDLNERLTALGYETGYQRIVVPHQESGGGGALPDGYTQVAWIESTGSQYIDTGVYPNQNTGLQIDLQTNQTNTSAGIAAVDTNWLNNDFSVFVGFFAYGSSNIPVTLNDGIKHSIEIQVPGQFYNDGSLAWAAPQATFQSAYPLTLFCLNRNNVKSDFFQGKIYSCKIYEGATLVRNFIPCKNNSNETGLYDLVNGQFYGNAGTGAFLAGPIPVELPDGYTQLEYIQSSGTQYINTGLSMPFGFRSVLDFEFTPQNNSAQAIIGSHDTLPPYNRNYLTINANYASWNIGCYDSDNFGIPQPNVRYKLDFCNISGKISCVINDINQELSQSIATNPARSSLPIYLFAMNYNGVSQPAYIKLYKCMIYDEKESLLRNYISCENDVGIVGLYDLVSGQFYENRGTGPFIGGPEIPKPAPEPEPVLDPYTWYEEDTLTESIMENYLANVEALRDVLEIGETPSISGNMIRLTLDEANAIEKILLVIEAYLVSLASVFRRSGAVICGGPGFYFVN